MKKIVFSNLPMKKQLNKFHYSVDGNSTIEYNGEVIFPVNSVLGKVLSKGEIVKVVLLKKLDIEGNIDIYAGKFMKELNFINRSIDADIEYKMYYEKALKKEPQMLINELIKMITLYNDKMRIELKTAR